MLTLRYPVRNNLDQQIPRGTPVSAALASKYGRTSLVTLLDSPDLRLLVVSLVTQVCSYCGEIC